MEFYMLLVVGAYNKITSTAPWIFYKFCRNLSSLFRIMPVLFDFLCGSSLRVI